MLICDDSGWRNLFRYQYKMGDYEEDYNGATLVADAYAFTNSGAFVYESYGVNPRDFYPRECAKFVPLGDFSYQRCFASYFSCKWDGLCLQLEQAWH